MTNFRATIWSLPAHGALGGRHHREAARHASTDSVDEDDHVSGANLIVSTTNNNEALNRPVTKVGICGGLVPAVAAESDRLGWRNLAAFDNYQLNTEDAMDVARHEVVWIVDAVGPGQSPYAADEVLPPFSIEFTSHLVRSEVILAKDRQCFRSSGSDRLHEIGIPGVFLKPVAAAVGIQMLRTRLGAGARDAARA